MQAALKLTARVLPGNRVEFTAPELTEGEEIELIVLKAENVPPRQFKDVIEFLDSLPKRNRTREEWQAIERELQEEKDAWER